MKTSKLLKRIGTIMLSILSFSLTLNAQTFTEVSTSLPSYYNSTFEWGDYDNDGDLDLVIMTYGVNVYRNDGNNVFTSVKNLIEVYNGDVAWGDYDNDGDLDVLVAGYGNSGYSTRVFRNDGSDAFTDIGVNILPISDANVDWGDYDNDGDLDILIIGYRDGIGWVQRVYEFHNNKYTLKHELGYNDGGDLVWGDYDNDGDLDILTSGSYSRIYQNNGESGFQEIEYFGNFAGSSSSVWGDYDNDGDLDVLITGYEGTILARNDGGNIFTVVTTNLPKVRYSYAEFGDIDNDGDLDIAITGYLYGEISEKITRVYRNDGNNVFTDIQAVLTGLQYGSLKMGDYDGDGDLDILVSGEYTIKLYKNNSIVANQTPSAPSNLSANISDNEVQFSWDKGNDTETPQNALSYSLRVGTASGLNDDFSVASGSDGQRKVVKIGNINLNNTWKLKDLQPGVHYWSVQTVDNGYKGSVFAPEQSFTYNASENYLPVTPNPVIFKTIAPNDYKSQIVQIINPLKYDTLRITDITLSNPVFSLDNTTFNIGPADTAELRILFSPTAVGKYEDTLKMTVNNAYIPLQKFVVQAYAATTVCGVITQNTTWTKANSPYFVDNCNLGIDQGATLTIEEGVLVIIDSMKRILVDGELVVNGTSSEPVTFIGDGSDKFEKIYFRANGKGALNYLNITKAHRGIYAENASLNINNSNINNCDTGICFLSVTNTKIRNSIIEANRNRGIHISVSSGIVFDNLQVKNNGNEGIFIENSNTFNIVNSNISNNNNWGIYVTETDNITIEGNTIEANLYGLYAHRNYYGNKFEILTNSIINNRGTGVDAYKTSIRNNIISKNYGTGVILYNSLFSSNQVLNNVGNGIESKDQDGNNNTILSNIIRDNSLNGIYETAKSVIQYNDILENKKNGIATTNIPLVNLNSLFGNKLYDIDATKQSSETINAEYNWWGTSISDSIKNHIRDFYDDAASVKVDYNPYKGSPIPLDTIRNFIALKDQPGKIKLSWKNEIKASSYILYFDNQLGTVDTTSAWVTLGSSTLSYIANLPVGNYKFAVRAISQSGAQSPLSYFNYTLKAIAVVSPEAIDFGTLRPSKYTDASITASIINIGDITLHIDNISGIVAPFSLNFTTPVDIASGDTIDMIIQLDRNTALKNYSSSLSLVSNADPVQSNVIVSVTANIVGIETPSGFQAYYYQDSVKLMWNKIISGDLAGYSLYRNINANMVTATKIASISDADSIYVDKTISSANSYYWVTSSDTAGYESAFSTPISTLSNPGIPRNGLIAWYPFNGNANDESNNYRDATVKGPILTSDRFGMPNGAYSFDGINDYIETNLNKGGWAKFSYSIWVKPLGFGPSAESDRIISHYNDCYGENFRLSLNHERSIKTFLYYQNPYNQYNINSEIIQFDQWYNIVLTYDTALSNKEYKIYLNGKLVTETDVQGYPYPWCTNYNLIFGGKAGSPTQEGFNGIIDDIAIYNRALTADEVSTISGSVTRPSKLDFSAIAVGQSKTLNVKFTNSSLGIKNYTIYGLSGPFSSSVSSLTVPENSDGSINVTFNPTTNGFFYDTLLIEQTDNSIPVIKVPVSGSGVTMLCGVITKDTILTKANSPYFTNCVFTIDVSATLTIEPGVVIQIDSSKQIIIDGSLVAEGTSEEPIRFISSNSLPFSRIYFRSANACTMSNCKIENANTGIYGENSGLNLSFTEISNCTNGVEMKNCIISFDSVFIHHNKHNGINCNLNTNNQENPHPENNTNTTNGTINRSIISNNQYYGIEYGAFTITNSQLKNNYGWAFYTSNNFNRAISNNLVEGNGSGINMQNSIISGNTFTNNKGKGIEGSYLTINENSITGNIWGANVNYCKLNNNKIQNNNSGGVLGSNLTLKMNQVIGNTGNGLQLSNSAIDMNNISYNTGNGINCTGLDTIRYNRVSYNGLNGISEGNNSIINGNDFVGNISNGIQTSSLPVVNNNNFANNNLYAIKATKQTNEILDATSNNWGTSQVSLIEARIYDYYDNGSSVKVDYAPYFESPDSLSPIVNFKAEKDQTGTMIISWTQPGLKASGFRLYTDNMTGALDTTNIWLTLDSSYSRYSVNLAVGEYIFGIRSFTSDGRLGPLAVAYYHLNGVVSITPDILDFGTYKQATSGNVTLSATLKNAGDKDLSIESISGVSSPFSLDLNVPKILTPGESVQINFTFNRNYDGGVFVQNLNFTSDASNQSEQGYLTIKGILQPIATPSNFRANYYKDSVQLSWDAVVDANLQGYIIYRSSTGDTTSATKIATLGSFALAYTVLDNIDKNVIYTYWVKAKDNQNFESYYSMPVQTIQKPVIPTTGLFAWYPFNGNAIDESYKGHNGFVYGPELTTDRFGLPGKAYSFDGANDYIETKYNFDSWSTFAVSLWIKPTGIGSGDIDRIISQYNNCCNQGEDVRIAFAHDQRINTKIATGWCQSYSEMNSVQSSIDFNQWYHIVYMHDGNLASANQKLYIDGKLVAQENLKGTVSPNCNLNLFIGGMSSNPTYGGFKGNIDDIAIYDRTLSNTEIYQLSKSYMVSPTKIEFKPTIANASDSVWFKITNTSNSAVSYIFNPLNNPFILSKNLLTVNAGATDSVKVMFSPALTGNMLDTLYIEYADHSKPIITIPVLGRAVTPVCGIYGRDTTWKKEFSPYYINCTMGVDSGVILTIEPGVTVVLDANRQIMVDGELRASGTSGEPVVFTNSLNNKFGKLYFRNGKGVFDNFIIEGAKRGIYGENATLTLSNGTIRNCEYGTEMDTGVVNIDNVTFYKNTSSAIYCYNGISGLIENCSITENNNAVFITDGSVEIIKNSIAENAGTGINVQNNKAKNIAYNVISRNGSGINAINCGLISNNTVDHNSGVGISTDNSTVISNTVSYNMQYGIKAVNNSIIEDNTVEYNQGDGIWTYNSYIKHNKILYNTGNGIMADWNYPVVSNIIEGNGMNGIYTFADFEIRNNKILDNKQDGINTTNNNKIFNNDILGNLNDGIEASALPVVNYNNIYSNVKYNVKATKQSFETLDAQFNFWNTVSKDEIDQGIFDYYDDGKSIKVNYKNYKSVPVPLTSITNFASQTKPGGIVELSWDMHPMANKYYLYKDHQDGYLDSTVIWQVIDAPATNYSSTMPDGDYTFGVRPVSVTDNIGNISSTSGRADGAMPKLIYADGQAGDTLLLVSFSEAINLNSVNNPSSWKFNNNLEVKKVLPVKDDELIIGVNNCFRLYDDIGNLTNPQWTLTNNCILNANYGKPQPAYADLDGDGDYDLLLGGEGNTLKYFENIGNKNTPSWQLVDEEYLKTDFYFNSVRFVDIDGDNDKDLFVAGNYSNLLEYENIGNDQAAVWSKKTLWYLDNQTNCIAFSDIDNDLDFDLFVLSTRWDGSKYTTKLNLYYNEGSYSNAIWSNIPVQINISLPNSYSLIPEFGDVDLDGDYDLLVGKEDGRISFYKNTGTPEEFSFVNDSNNYVNETDWYGNASPAFVDIDGNSRHDAVYLVLDGQLPAMETAVTITCDSVSDRYNNTSFSESVVLYPDDGNKNPVAIINNIPGEVNSDISINYTITDAENDTMFIRPRYSTDGGLTWKIPTFTGDTLNIDKSKYSGSLIWHSYTDLPGYKAKNVRFKVTPRDGDTRIDGSPGITNKMVVDNNIEPVIAIDPVYGEVKDTVLLNFTIIEPESDLVKIVCQYYNNTLNQWKNATILGDSLNLSEGGHSIKWIVKNDLPTAAEVILFRIMGFDNEFGNPDTVSLVVDNIGISSVQFTQQFPVETGSDIVFNYLISDDEQDTISLRAEYSVNGGTWKTPTITGNFIDISSENYTGSFTWHTITDFPITDAANVVFRLTPNDGKDGIVAKQKFHIDNNLVPSCVFQDIAGLKRGDITLKYTLSDPENNVLSIKTRVLANGTWKDATLTGKTSSIYLVNYSGSVVWNSATDLPEADGTYKLVLIPLDNDAGVPDTIQIQVNNTNIIDLGQNTAMCKGETKTFDAGCCYKDYLWNTGATTQTIEVTTPGTYYIIAHDYSNLTHYSDSIVMVVNDLPSPNIGSDVKLCLGSSVTLDAGSFSSYNWNTGNSTKLLTVDETGNYFATVTDMNNCQNSDTVYVFVQSPYDAEQICFVTVDNQLNKNAIIWSKTSDKGTDSYNIYRENTNGGYEVIGTQSFDNAGIFIDTLSFSDQLKYNYKLSLVDTCGHESALSSSHGSIFLKVNKGSAGFDLTWTAYEGISVAKYEVYRGNDSSNLALVKEIAGSITSWSDNFVPQCVVYYQIRVQVASECKSAGGSDYTYISSNIAGNGAVKPRPVIIGPTSFCDGEKTILDAGNYTTYLWSNGKTSQVNEISTGGSYTVTVSNEFGCYGTSNPFLVTVNLKPQFNLGSDTTICSSQTLILSGPDGYSSYIWDNGSTQKDRTIIANGLINLTVTDNNGCQGSDEMLVTYISNPVIDLNPVEYICSGEPRYLDPGDFAIYEWSNGSNSRIQKVTDQGIISVKVTDNNGCSSSKQITVDTRNVSTVSLGADTSVCTSDSLEIFPKGSFVSYQWSTGSTADRIFVSKSGNYIVWATDIFKCTTSDTIFVALKQSPVTPVLGKDTTLCLVNNFVLDAGQGYAAYKWNTGETTQRITAKKGGIFEVTVTGSNGCFSSADVEVNMLEPYADEKLCVVTIDNETGKNLLVWERTANMRTASYVVYKETNQAGVYKPIDTVPYSNLSIYLDESSVPGTRSERYRISTIDSCGNESVPSESHKTMHLTINVGVEEQFNLIWESYQGLDFKSYVIYRGPSSDSLEILDTVPSNITTYTDVPPKGTYFYQIGMILSGMCRPSKFLKAGAGPYSESVSNMEKRIKYTNAVSFANVGSIKVYPTIVSDYLNIKALGGNTYRDAVLELVSVNGQIMKRLKMNQIDGLQSINLSDMSSGLYLLKITGNNLQFKTKIEIR